ncbi:MAG: hypothetical protein ABIP55_15830, partial [Tepidisphaeraceae bacterium]
IARDELEKKLDAQGIEPADRPMSWNDIRLARGRVRLWGRRAEHAPATPTAAGGDDAANRAANGAVAETVVQTHVIADFERLDLDQLVHAFDPAEKDLPGRLSGKITLHGDPRDPTKLFGQGSIRIAESDLVEVDVLNVLYSLLSAPGGNQSKGGAGNVEFSLQSGTLTLNNFHYFNRGVEAWSNNVTIENVWQMPHSPLSGYVVGSARPLSALKLPFLADVDQIMSVLQSNLTTVKMEGTVGKYKAIPATFSDVGDGLKRFMRGQVTQSK